jgi:protein-S-isoprenylcysteine O-methyltransferase Ste14
MRNTLLTITGTILVPSILHIFLPFLILQSTSVTSFPSIGFIEVVSILLALFGISIVIWVSITFVRHGKGTAVPFYPPTEFVALGLYRFVRNPMYVGIFLVIIAEAIFFRSVWLLVYGAFLWLPVQIYVIRVEEPQLESRFGASYRNYKTTTPRWIPRIHRQSGA